MRRAWLVLALLVTGVLPRTSAVAETRERDCGAETDWGAELARAGGDPAIPLIGKLAVTLRSTEIRCTDNAGVALHRPAGAALTTWFPHASACSRRPPTRIMLLEVTCPEDELGAVIGDIGRRRGEVLALDARGADRVVRAEVPLAETFGYASALGGLTHGRGRFVLEPARYAPVAG